MKKIIFWLFGFSVLLTVGSSGYSLKDKKRNGWDWNGIIGTGQSLSVGAQGFITTKSQPYHNLKLSLGNATIPPWDENNKEFAVAPLTEPIRPKASGYPSAYPRNIYGETFHSVMANQITALVQAADQGDYISVHTVVGESGQGMSVIRKGALDTGKTGRAYRASLFEAETIMRLAKAAGKTYGIGGIVLTHGEADAGNNHYEEQIYQLWKDYQADLTAITGQTQKIPMFVSQQHSCPGAPNSRSAATLAQWHIGISHPGDILCSGPKYQYQYVADGIHLTEEGYDQLGEKLGEIYYHKVVLGQNWQPLQPLGVTRKGQVIAIRFHVPVLPLVLDEKIPAPHQEVLTEWANGKGFEVRAADKRITISSVAVQGDQVLITCAERLPSNGIAVGYAMTADDSYPADGTYRSGQLCDSDLFVGWATRKVQPNYCVAFEINVP